MNEEELNQTRSQMLHFACLQLNNENLAEDLVQEAFLSAFKNISAFKGQSAFKTWVFAILKNKIIDYLRQKGRLFLETELETDENYFFDHTQHWQLDAYPSPIAVNEDTVYSQEFWLLFEACLTHLPAKQARVFMMREYLDLSTQEICAETALSQSNLHTILHRARLQLQHCLSRKL